MPKSTKAATPQLDLDHTINLLVAKLERQRQAAAATQDHIEALRQIRAQQQTSS